MSPTPSALHPPPISFSWHSAFSFVYVHFGGWPGEDVKEDPGARGHRTDSLIDEQRRLGQKLCVCLRDSQAVSGPWTVFWPSLVLGLQFEFEVEVAVDVDVEDLQKSYKIFNTR